MKEIICDTCGVVLVRLEKGAVRKGIRIFCEDCVLREYNFDEPKQSTSATDPAVENLMNLFGMKK